MFKTVICAALIASPTFMQASQATNVQQAAQTKPNINIDAFLSSEQFQKRMPRDLTSLIGTFLSYSAPSKNKHDKENKSVSDFYHVTKEFLPILLPVPCAGRIKAITQRAALIHQRIIQADAECNYATDKRLAMIGQISGELCLPTTWNSTLDWEAQQNRYIRYTPQDKSCVNNQCYNKKNPKAKSWIDTWEKELQKTLSWTLNGGYVHDDSAFYYGYSDNSLHFAVLPVHKATISRLTLQQQQFLIELYAAYEISDGQAHIDLNWQQIETLQSFPQEMQEKIRANYPIRLPFFDYCYNSIQQCVNFTKKHTQACTILGTIAAVSVAWIIWRKVYKPRMAASPSIHPSF